MPESFHLEIHGLQSFALFVSVIRGQDLDPAKLYELINRLKAGTADLAEAEKPYLGGPVGMGQAGSANMNQSSK